MLIPLVYPGRIPCVRTSDYLVPSKTAPSAVQIFVFDHARVVLIYIVILMTFTMRIVRYGLSKVGNA